MRSTIKKQYSTEELLYKATAYCSTAERCESEVRQKLADWSHSQQEIQDKIIDYLYEEQFLDTYRYCKAFVNDKLRFQHWGRVKIRTMLKLKGLPKTEIETSIRQIDEELYIKILSDLAQQKIRSAHLNTADSKDTEKLIRFLLQRGFEYEVICKTLNEVL